MMTIAVRVMFALVMLAGVVALPSFLPASETLASRLAGRILLAVEEHGEAWYVDPVTLHRVYLGTPQDAWELLKTYGLGITSKDLAQVPTVDDESVLHSVPFVAQAPFGEWSDSRQAEGCEEASVLMALAWANGTELSAADAREAIIAMSTWENETYGSYYDTSIDDTAERLLRQYMDYDNITVAHDVTVDDIRAGLESGVVLIAANGVALGNPNYVGAGPDRHMLLVIGYDAATDEFITNDPGTRLGASYRYSSATIASALRDYLSGNHAPITPMPTGMIVVSR